MTVDRDRRLDPPAAEPGVRRRVRGPCRIGDLRRLLWLADPSKAKARRSTTGVDPRGGAFDYRNQKGF